MIDALLACFTPDMESKGCLDLYQSQAALCNIIHNAAKYYIVLHGVVQCGVVWYGMHNVNPTPLKAISIRAFLSISALASALTIAIALAVQ